MIEPSTTGSETIVVQFAMQGPAIFRLSAGPAAQSPGRLFQTSPLNRTGFTRTTNSSVRTAITITATVTGAAC